MIHAQLYALFFFQKEKRNNDQLLKTFYYKIKPLSDACNDSALSIMFSSFVVGIVTS